MQLLECMTGMRAFAISLILASSAAVSLIGCSSVQVSSQTSPTVNLTDLKTFAFASPTAGAQPPNSIVQTQIKESVQSDLAKIGITPAPPAVPPDFVVAYTTNVYNVVTGNQSSVGVGFGAAPGVGVGFGTPVGSANVEQRGSLILSFVDPQKNMEIWRSTAIAGLDGSNRDVQKIQEAVQKMIGEFEDARGKKS